MPSYKNAIDWIAQNDDCEWLGDCSSPQGVTLSISARFVRDLWFKDDERLVNDVKKALKKYFPDHEIFKNSG